MGEAFLASKGVKDPNPDQFNPYGAILYKQKAKGEISPAAARLFLELSEESKVPPWAIAAVDIKLIRAAAA